MTESAFSVRRQVAQYDEYTFTVDDASGALTIKRNWPYYTVIVSLTPDESRNLAELIADRQIRSGATKNSTAR